MIKLEFRHKAGRLIRIGKREARKRYHAGEDIHIISSNFAPVGPWITALPINQADENEYINNAGMFDRRVRNYEWYNCINTETGLYASYYRLVA